jgi:histidine triad (HIT) family protein
MSKSLFTKIIDREIPATIIAENDAVIVINDINPKTPIHFLIIPKKEIKDVQSCASQDFNYIEKMFKMAQELSQKTPGAKDFRLVINSGADAGQQVFHLHMHFLSGTKMSD